jgi:hypothetical protein
MDAEYKTKNQKYKADLEKWTAKYNIQPEDLKKEKEKKKKKGDDSDDEVKSKKTKGAKHEEKKKV